MVSHMDVNGRRIVKVEEVRLENPWVKTFLFHDNLCAKASPGQFIMVWVLGVDEIPMSLSNIAESGYSGITVAGVGDATKALHERNIGDRVGIRGPLGRGFTPVSGRVALVAGGTGVTPLAPLAEELRKHGLDQTFILGAKTWKELLLMDRVERALSDQRSKFLAVTEDGSYGLKGDAVTVLHNLLKKEKFDTVYTCGCGAMVAKVFKLAVKYGLRVQASLEAYMKCAIGLCGSCCIGPYRVCVDGPVFSEKELMEMPELGVYSRDASGAKVKM